MLHLVAGALILLLAGCGGGGGGGSTPVPPEATGIPETYYPVTVGARWAYDVTSSDAAASFIDEVAITGVTHVADVIAWIFRDSNPGGDGIPVESYYAKDARAFTYLGDNSSANWIASVIKPMELMRFDGSFSASPLLNRSDIDIGVDLDGDRVNDRLDVKVNGVVEGVETLSTRLGSFSSTARLRYDITGSVKLSHGGTVPVAQTLHEWRAPDVGTLRQSIQTTIGTTSTSETLDVRGMLVNNIGAGILPPTDLMIALANANSDATKPGRPALASDGKRYLLVSRKDTATDKQLTAEFVGANGLVQSEFAVSPPSPSSASGLAAASDGSGFVLVTTRGDDLHAQRISGIGEVLDPYPGLTLLSSDQVGYFSGVFSPAVAYGANTYLVVYTEFSEMDGLSVNGIRISRDGVIGSPFRIGTGEMPSLAFNGTDFLVAWVSGQNADRNLFAARVSPRGMVLDATPIEVSTAPEAQYSPKVACDATNCLVTWIDRRNYPGQSYSFSPGPGDMYGSLVTHAGNLLNGPAATGGIAIATGITANADYPGLVFTGSDYLLAWSRGAYVNNPGGPTGIYAAHVSINGTVTPAAPGLVVSGPPVPFARLYYPTLAATPSGVLAVWLNNTEMTGSTKSIAATVIWPAISR
ncbi:MAG TPA: hypothetical protein VJ698_04005 [Noviherbaspirillum sp.]|uniref:hypothetical protein n=1 Tax=Noviherbaspirillum sp. TaxID=1926288 RepID=UPI002B4A4B9A|nr:hypothetical protein [Noviherbaspirillum sp.]HJV84615.1 hypothetical protein [Noviherbaspirillum sp.]